MACFPGLSPAELNSKNGAIVLRFSLLISTLIIAVALSWAAPFERGRAPGARGNTEASARQLLHHALYLADLYNWAGAGPYFAQAQKMFLAAGDERNALYARLGVLRADAARLNLPETSAQLARELDSNPSLRTDKQLRMFCLIIKGDIDGEINARAMREDWQHVEALARQLGNLRWEYRASAQLGLAAFYRGDVVTARRNVGLALAEAKAGGDKGAEILYLTAFGIALVDSKMYAQALPYFDHALVIAHATPDAGYQFVTEQWRLHALIGLHRIHAARKLDAEFLAQARKERRPGQEAQALIVSSAIDEAGNDASRALSNLKKSLAISKPAGYLGEVGQEQSGLANLYAELGNLGEAEHFATLAVASTEQSGDVWSVPVRLETLAEVKAAEGDYPGADRIYERAEAFIDSSVAAVSGVLDKTAFIKASGGLYAQHFRLIAEHFNNPAKAFSIIEQVRGRVATDLLIAGSRTSTEAAADERALSALRLKLMAAHSTAEVRAIRNQIFMAEQARWVTPDLSILKVGSREPFGIDRVQNTLGPSTLLLEYVAADPHSYCLVVSPKEARIVPLAGEDRIGTLVAAYRKAVAAKQTAHYEGRQLYDALLRRIPEVHRASVLVIVRDGPLYLVPFDGLVDSTGRYVVEDHTIVYAPSATAYCLLAEREQSPQKFRHQLLAVGGVPYNDPEMKGAGALRGFGNHELSLLPGSKQEVLAAAAAIDEPSDTVLIGPDATKYAFEHQKLAQYRIIHMAVHGFADRDYPDRSALILLSDPSAGEDGFLEASEIVQFRIRADLVILSACDTAVGPIEGEEGTATLARAFLLAGAKSAISTLWSIDDTYSFVLMKHFYKHLASGDRPASALAEAKRDMLQDLGQRVLPYYWAGFIFEGPAD